MEGFRRASHIIIVMVASEPNMPSYNIENKFGKYMYS